MSFKQADDPNGLAVQVIAYSRRLITRQAPILLGAVYALQEKKRDIPGPISTDGIHLWYDPQQVLADFRQDRNSVAEQILHITLHCLLGHLNVRDSYVNPDLFDALADCKTAQFVSELGCRLGNSWLLCVPWWIESGPTSLPALYRYAEVRQRSLKELIRQIRDSHICMDDHRLWNPRGPPSPPFLPQRKELPPESRTG